MSRAKESHSYYLHEDVAETIKLCRLQLGLSASEMIGEMVKYYMKSGIDHSIARKVKDLMSAKKRIKEVNHR